MRDPPRDDQQRFSPLRRPIELLLVGLTLPPLAWSAHFWRFRSLGFYEDDYAFVAQPIGLTLPELVAQVFRFLGWSQGRPFGFALAYILSFFGFRLGGLPMIYVFGYLIVLANGALAYGLLRRLAPPSAAAAGALMFILFPADTTRTLLTHSLTLQPALTLALLAGHAYLRRRRDAAYVLLCATLLTYESPALPLLALPLLTEPWDRRLRRPLIVHLLICATLFVAMALFRRAMGDARLTPGGLETNLAGQSILVIPARAAASMIIGPAVALGLTCYRAFAPFQAAPGMLIAAVAPAAAVIFFTLEALRARSFGCRSDPAPESSADSIPARAGSISPAPAAPLSPLKLILAGLVMLALAYGLAFTHFPPTTSAGRATSVHLGATIGVSLAFSGLAWRLFLLPWPRLMTLLLGTYLGLLVGFGLVVQADFADNWRLQRAFWRDVLELCPDAGERTTLFVTGDPLPETRFILTHSWADRLVLQYAFRIPTAWNEPPRLFVVEPDWAEGIRTRWGRFFWEPPLGQWHRRWELIPGNFILLEHREGRLIRSSGAILVAGQPFALKPLEPAQLAALPTQPLYPLLFEP